MASAEEAEADVIGGIDLDGEEYTVEQSLVRNKYKVYGPDGDLVLKSKQKLFKMKEEFPFQDADGNVVFRVKAEGILDVAGDYTITDEATEEPIAVLGKNFTLFKHVWKVRSPDDERLLATISSGSTIVEVLRSISSLFNLIPHTYTIEGPDGEDLGSIEGQFSLRDRYTIHLGDTGEVPREAMVAACVAIDALEGN